MSKEPLISPIREWLVGQALRTPNVVEMFESLCMQLVGVGIPIRRARLLWPTLHPLFQAETVVWDRGKPAYLEQFVHQETESEAWKRSPLKFVIENDVEIFRRQLTGENENLDFPMLKDLKEEGLSDYMVLATFLEWNTIKVGTQRNSRGVLSTWASDRPDGFSDEDLVALQKIQKRLAVACKSIIMSRITENVASTYLGNRAGVNVLEGQIRRGDGQQTSAVVWYSDMRNSTSLTETMAPEEYFSLLNSYFEATAEPVVEHGGEILDFIGDAVLGIFPYHEHDELVDAAQSATKALDQVIDISKELNLAREKEGAEQFKFGVGLNVGDVMFGNIGIPSRLTFSVIGPTVNEVARIESMTKFLQKPILAGAKVASLTPDRWVPAGEHKLDGVLEPMELFSFKN